MDVKEQIATMQEAIKYLRKSRETENLDIKLDNISNALKLLDKASIKGSIKEYLKTEINMEEKKAALIEANLLGEVIRSLEDYRKDIYAAYKNEELDEVDEEREDIIKGTVKFAFADLSKEGE